jgi:hypothetical protein
MPAAVLYGGVPGSWLQSAPIQRLAEIELDIDCTERAKSDQSGTASSDCFGCSRQTPFTKCQLQVIVWSASLLHDAAAEDAPRNGV